MLWSGVHAGAPNAAPSAMTSHVPGKNEQKLDLFVVNKKLPSSGLNKNLNCKI